MSAMNSWRLLFPDTLGLPRGKQVFGGWPQEGRVRFSRSVWGLVFDGTVLPVPGSDAFAGLPDMEVWFDAKQVLPAWGDGSVTPPDEAVHLGGVVLGDAQHALCGRALLRRAVQAWKASLPDCEPILGFELEGYLLPPQASSGDFSKSSVSERHHAKRDAVNSVYGAQVWHAPGRRGQWYGTGVLQQPRGRLGERAGDCGDFVLDAIAKQAQRIGLPLRAMHAEQAPGQWEFALAPAPALQAVDACFLFKLMAQEVACSLGWRLSFAPKPIWASGFFGSGLHLNFSVQHQGQNALGSQAWPTRQEVQQPGLLRSCLAGLLAHHCALTALAAPTANSYQRLTPSSTNGYWADWGLEDRLTTVRVAGTPFSGVRIEHRMADSSANLYAYSAAALHAMRLGYEAGSAGRALPLSEPKTQDPERIRARTDRLGTIAAPHNLGLALQALQADMPLIRALGSEWVAHWCLLKEYEEAFFRNQPPDVAARYAWETF
jgi:glutamine synthetase